MAVELRFQFPVEPTPGPVELKFGRTLGAVTIEGTLAATLPPAALSLTFAARVVPVVLAAAEAALPAPALALTLAAAAVQDLDLPSDVGPSLASRQAQALPTAGALAIAQQTMLPARTPLASAQQHAAPLASPLGLRQHQMLPARRPLTQRHASAIPLAARTAAPHAEQLRTRHRLGPRHAHGLPITAGTRAPHAEQIRLRHRLAQRHASALPTTVGTTARHHHGLPTATRLAVRQQQAMPLPVGFWQGSLPGQPPAPPSQYSSPVRLVFWRLNDGTTRLVFGNRPASGEQPGGSIVIPVLRSYIVVNSVSLARVSNALQIPALSLQISIDADTWGWGWSASVPAAQLDNLLPDAPGAPIELEAQINGVVWRLLVERIARDRRHGSDRLAISGRGIAAQLAAPLYPEESRDNVAGALMAQQLADAALAINGVPLGWTLDWQIADWLVPAGAWVHTGTPMDAVVRIAQAAGGYVQANPSLQTLHILPRYPHLPWEWAAQTPAFILPSSATTREATEYVERPDYNLIYVSGGSVGGVLGQVKKAGTAGDMPAEMIVDPLITHVDAARGRGASILGDTGPQQILTLETPIIEAVGVYPVGSLIEWQEGTATRRGLVRSVSINAALPRVRQTIEVECHG